MHLVRQLLLPRQVERTLRTVLAQDLLGKTPFREDHIFHDHIAQRAGDKLHVRQWMLNATQRDDEWSCGRR